MKIFYWSPFFTNIATISAVIKSANSLKLYSNKKIDVSLIDAIGEWDKYSNKIDKNIEIIKLNNFNLIKFLPKNTYIKSRISYIIIFLINFFKLLKIINNKKPDYLIIHLITSLPISLSYFFNNKTKLVLRISGYPKINIFRKYFWKFFSKKIYAITCPTEATKKLLIQKNIFEKEKILVLKDPVIDIKDFINKKNQILSYKDLSKKDFIIGIGRLTKQKNFQLLINSFSYIIKYYNDLKLVLIGTGEDEKSLKSLARKLNIEDNVYFVGYQDNVYKFLKKAKIFILSSLWEDPGFVLIEAIMSNTPVVASDCPNGPKEILVDDKFLYKNNSLDSLNRCILKTLLLDTEERKKNSLFLKRRIRDFTKFNHYKNLIDIIK